MKKKARKKLKKIIKNFVRDATDWSIEYGLFEIEDIGEMDEGLSEAVSDLLECTGSIAKKNEDKTMMTGGLAEMQGL